MLDRPNTLTVVIPESSESALKYEYSRDTRLLSLSRSLSPSAPKTKCGLNTVHQRRVDMTQTLICSLYTETDHGPSWTSANIALCFDLCYPGGAAIRISNQESVISR